MWKVGMPNLGHTMEKGRIVEWLKAPGEAVEPGDILAVVETDKVTVDVESPAAGLLLEVIAEVDEDVLVGRTIAIVGRAEEAADAAAARAALTPLAEPELEPVGAGPAEAPAHADSPPTRTPATTPAVPPRARGGRVPSSPLARRRAADLGIDLAAVPGTGPDGIVVRADVEAAAVRAGSLVLIHGFGADLDLWAPVRAAGRLPLPVTALALPGHRDGPPLPERCDAAGLAAALRIDAPPGGPLHIVGHSLGGAVAVEFARLLGKRVASLTLIAPSGLGALPDAGFVADLLAGADAERAAGAAARLVADPARLSRTFAADLSVRLADPAHAAALAAIASAAFGNGADANALGGQLAALEVPVLLVWGREDAVVPPPDPRTLPPGCDLLLLSGAGHLLPAERPAALAAILSARLREHLKENR